MDETYLVRMVDLATSGLRHCVQMGLAVVVGRLCQPVVVWEEDESITANQRLALCQHISAIVALISRRLWLYVLLIF